MVRWLDKSYMEKTLQKAYNDKSITIKGFVLRPTSLDGQNYASSIYRVIITYECKSKSHVELSLIAKLITGKINSLADETSYDTEVQIYERVLPEIERLLSTGSKFKISPNLIFSTKKPQPTIFFNDLAELKYQMMKTRCDFEELKIILENLAKFHAVSYHLSTEGKIVQQFAKGLFNSKDNDGVKFIKDSFDIFKNVIKDWDDHEKYSVKLEEASENFFERAEKIYQPSKGINVLNHGDFHYKNFMVKRGADQMIDDVMFLDYQLSVYASPAIDFFYMLYMVASDEARENRSEIVQYYYEVFKKTLTDIGFIGHVFSLLDLNVELLSNGFLELIIAVCFVPFFYVDEIQSTAEDVISKNTKELREKLFNSEKYRAFITPLLVEFSNKGIL